jgi:hypothetical protein
LYADHPDRKTGRLLIARIGARGQAVLDKNREDVSNEPPQRGDDNATRPVSNRGLAIFFAMLITALVLGYLFLNKLADISQEEDCALGNRYNCGAVVAPGR